MYLACTKSNVYPLLDTDSFPSSHSQAVLRASGACSSVPAVTGGGAAALEGASPALRAPEA